MITKDNNFGEEEVNFMPHTNFTTLCYIETEDSYLMLHRVKKEGDMNRDKWLGVGGHFEKEESPEECLLREVKEETGLTLLRWRFRGLVTFVSDRWPEEYMCLYTADRYEGTIGDCREGQLEWVKKDQIRELSLWEGDLIFFELLQNNQPFFSLKLCYKGERLTQAVLDGSSLELLDERDADGSVTGRARARFLMHRYGDLHGTSHVWIVRPNYKSGFDLLLQKRSEEKDAFPGCYDISSAGHIPAGDDYLESAVRELEEELGITVRPEELTFVGLHDETDIAEFYGKPFHNHEICRVYVYTRPIEADRLKLQKEEVESVMWIDYDECLSRIENHTLKNCLNVRELQMLKTWWTEGGRKFR